MKRSEKEHVIAEVTNLISRARGLYFTDFTGITVEEINELRREFRKSNIGYRVVKNTLIRKALERVPGYDKVYDYLVGPVALALGFEDPVIPAKIIKKFQTKHQKLNVKVCVLEKQVFEGSKLDELAQLPSRTDMIAGIVASLQSPISGIVGTVNAVMRDLVSVISEIEKKKAA